MDSFVFPKKNDEVGEKVLERLCFERSKVWANLFETIEANAHNDVVDVAVKDLPSDACDSSDEDETMNEVEEAVESDVDDQPSFPKMINRPAIDGSMCVEDVLNETQPILHEHQRRWKEAGLDAVLNTFDKEKIERVVGGWLRNHGNETIQTEEKHNKCSESSDTDSLHSVDTARYVRTSLKRITRTKRPTSMIRAFKKQTLHKQKCMNAYRQCSCHQGPVLPKMCRSECCSGVTNSKEQWTNKAHFNANQRSLYGSISSTSSSDEDDESIEVNSWHKQKSLNNGCEVAKKTNSIFSSAITCKEKKRNDFKQYKLFQKKQKHNQFRRMIQQSPDKPKTTNKSTGMKVPLKSIPAETSCTPKRGNLLGSAHSAKNSKKIKSQNKKGKKAEVQRSSESSYESESENSLELKLPLKKNKDEEIEPQQRKYSLRKFASKKENKMDDDEKISEKEDITGSDTSFERDLAAAIKLSKLTARNERRRKAYRDRKAILTNGNISENLSTNSSFSIESKPKSRKNLQSKNFELENAKSVFSFNETTNICNSTAFNDDAAKHRQFGFLPSIPEVSTCSTSSNGVSKTQSKSIELLTPLKSTIRAIDKLKLSSAEKMKNPPKTIEKNLRKEREISVDKMYTPTTIEKSQRSILVYTPQQKHLASDGYFHINEQSLSASLGEKLAKQLARYHVGARQFPSSSKVYYCPPSTPLKSGSGSETSYDDLELFGTFGEFYASPEKDFDEN